uniref:Uncharacterized protein n=1 Tax=Solanum tuberosum TaxID=4113 RepID=M1CPG7_SOLTU
MAQLGNAKKRSPSWTREGFIQQAKRDNISIRNGATGTKEITEHVNTQRKESKWAENISHERL